MALIRHAFYVEKESIRKTFDELKKGSKKILAGKMEPETRFFIKALLSVMEIMAVLLLEKRTRKNSGNSGLPPSSDPGGNGNRNKGNSGEKKNVGSSLENSKIEKREETLSPDKCEGCGAGLEEAPVTETEKREIIDIIYTVVKTTLTAETRECTLCGDNTKAKFPEGVDGKIQYGAGIKAGVINFLMVQMLSLRRTAEHFMGLTGRLISEATMLKYVAQFGESLKEWEKWAKKELAKATVLYVDETGMRVKKKNYWIHTCSSGNIVLQIIHPKRGLVGMWAMGILEKYGGVVVHDCWSPYFSLEGVLHALCNSHLMRELKFVEDSSGHRWATKMKRLLKTAVAMVGSAEEKILSADEYIKLVRMYEEILMEGLLELPGMPETSGKGRYKYTEAQNLWLRLFHHRDAVLLFAKMAEVDATNNRAERDLRMNKVKKKVSGCFRTFEMAENFCRIYSYVKTMRNMGYSSLQAITLALKGEIPMPRV